jgi:Mycothiol maleylpyruvate isomerase N-terminal domain
VDQTIAELAAALPAAPDRPVRISFWGPWSLRLDDLLLTRTMELAVHADDLACSVGLTTPPLPPGAADAVLTLLLRIAVGRHGSTPLLRALARPERTPAPIPAWPVPS